MYHVFAVLMSNPPMLAFWAVNCTIFAWRNAPKWNEGSALYYLSKLLSVQFLVYACKVLTVAMLWGLSLSVGSAYLGPYMNYGLEKVFSPQNLFMLFSALSLYSATNVIGKTKEGESASEAAWVFKLIDQVLQVLVLQLVLAFLCSFSSVNLGICIYFAFKSMPDDCRGRSTKEYSAACKAFSVVNLIQAVNMCFPAMLPPLVSMVARELFVPLGAASLTYGVLSLKLVMPKVRGSFEVDDFQVAAYQGGQSVCGARPAYTV